MEVAEIIQGIMKEQGLKTVAYCTDCQKVVSSSGVLDSWTIHATDDAGALHAQVRNHWVVVATKNAGDEVIS